MMASLFSLASHLEAMPKPTRVVHLKAPLKLLSKYLTKLKSLSKEKHSSLFVPRISHKQNNFIALTPMLYNLFIRHRRSI